MADVINTFASLSNDAPNVMITKRMYELAERNLATGEFAKEYELDNYMSKTMRIVRYNRFNLPTQTLTEGVPPDSVSLGFVFVDVTVEQWGIVALLTDVSILTITHPILQIAIERCALAIAELTERENCKVLMAGTSVIYGNSGDTVRSSIVNTGTPKTNRMTTSTIINATVQLRSQGAPTWDGDLYGVIIQPQQEGDLLGADATFQAASNFARVRKLENAEIGIWMGGHYVRGNFLPIFQAVAAPTGSTQTATRAKSVAADTGGTLTAGDFLIVTVGRDITSDYERRISLTSAAMTVGVGVTTGSITVTTPTSVNYVYDIYCTLVGGTTLYKVASRIAAATNFIITTSPAGTETTAPVAPGTAAQEIFIAWMIGKDAFARVKLNQMSMQSYITPAGASWSNPLAQGRKVGTKMMYKTAIQDQNFLVRMETVSTYSAFLPA